MINKIYNKSKEYPKYISLNKDTDGYFRIVIQSCYEEQLPGFMDSSKWRKVIDIYVDKLFIKQLMLNIEIAMSDKKIIADEMWVNNPNVYGYAQYYDIAICREGGSSLTFTAYRNRGVEYKTCYHHDITLEIEEIRMFYKALKDIIK